MKSSRLLSIMLLLQTRGRVSARELAERLEVSRRTIYRDVEALSAAGVPLYAERGRAGGIALLPGYRTDVTGLTGTEAQALFVLAAEGVHADLGLDDAFKSALHKLLAAVPAPHRADAERVSERIVVDPTRWLHPKGAAQRHEHLGALQAAVFADLRVRMRYRHSGANRERRYTVDPYGLVAKAGVWYLVADHRREPRLFRVDRVASAEPLDETVRRRPGVDLADLWDLLRRQVEERPRGIPVRARVRERRFDMFARIFAADIVESTPAGEWCEVRLRFPGVPAARQVLAFGADVEVLEPASVREDLAATVRDLDALYESARGA